MPLSAVTGRADIMDSPGDGAIGGTFGGNPLACAAALAVIEMFQSGDILAKAKALGVALQSRLAKLAEKHPAIGEVRGLGPMQALELVKDRATKAPNPELAKALVQHCYERGLVIMTAGSYGNVVRLLMPLVTTVDQLDEGLAILDSGLASHR